MTRDYGPWANLRRRLEQAATGALRNNRGGMAVVRVSVYVNGDGVMVGWEEPEVSRLEPSRINWVEALKGVDVSG